MCGLTFPRFTELPKELQIEIWEYALLPDEEPSAGKRPYFLSDTGRWKVFKGRYKRLTMKLTGEDGEYVYYTGPHFVKFEPLNACRLSRTVGLKRWRNKLEKVFSDWELRAFRTVANAIFDYLIDERDNIDEDPVFAARQQGFRTLLSSLTLPYQFTFRNKATQHSTQSLANRKHTTSLTTHSSTSEVSKMARRNDAISNLQPLGFDETASNLLRSLQLSEQLPTFPRFAELPKEIQMMIWEYALTPNELTPSDGSLKYFKEDSIAKDIWKYEEVGSDTRRRLIWLSRLKTYSVPMRMSFKYPRYSMFYQGPPFVDWGVLGACRLARQLGLERWKKMLEGHLGGVGLRNLADSALITKEAVLTILEHILDDAREKLLK